MAGTTDWHSEARERLEQICREQAATILSLNSRLAAWERAGRDIRVLLTDLNSGLNPCLAENLIRERLDEVEPS